jgi:hypothetical protein
VTTVRRLASLWRVSFFKPETQRDWDVVMFCVADIFWTVVATIFF